MDEIILACDTTQGACSVALLCRRDAPVMILREMQKGHVEALMPMMAAIFEKTNITPTQITRLGVTTGPGGFAGVRLGLAAMRAMALALARPLIGVPTMDAMAMIGAGAASGTGETDSSKASKTASPVLIVIDARGGTYFAQMFNAASLLSQKKPALLTPQAYSLSALLSILPPIPLALIGSGADAIRAARQDIDDIRPKIAPYPQAAMVAKMVRDMPISSPYVPPSPIYLRPPRATLPDGRKTIERI